ncbi:hypothetical protein C4573_02470 [Candidatus Woesearchaeota archaeon]|nr:MAG: hypothetical protein C4573_02470 [Candidatus Woesearchaeota archaeon]
MTLTDIVQELQTERGLSAGSIKLLEDRGFEEPEYARLNEILQIGRQTFSESRTTNWVQKEIELGDALEITEGRYHSLVERFHDISSEQALVQGRMKFAVEYVIALSDELVNQIPVNALVRRKFTDDEKLTLRSIYKTFSVQDYLAVKLIERKTDHDVVSANTWATIRAQQLGFDESLMRRIVHFARTSDDVNANVTGNLYMKAIAEWTSTVSDLLRALIDKAKKHRNVTCIAETHGQPAQLDALEHIYANLAMQLVKHLEPLVSPHLFMLEGKIAGATGTDVDMKAAFPQLKTFDLYHEIITHVFGLGHYELGMDQSSTYAKFSQFLDVMTNVGLVMQKAATDVWLYASNGMLAKANPKGVSGSSAMPQKINPYFAEGAEAALAIAEGMTLPIKRMLVAYRTQGDLRRSFTLREAFHPVMLSIIGMKRLTKELERYEPDIIGIETAIYQQGPKIASSAVQSYLRAHGVEDAYDGLKDIVMKPVVKPSEVIDYVDGLVRDKRIDRRVGDSVKDMLFSVMDMDGNLDYLLKGTSFIDAVIHKMHKGNADVEHRKHLLGNAISQTEEVIDSITTNTRQALQRYRDIYQLD